ncbi:hypothetical protein [Flavobacterium panacagri]|uniref:hypothetical protein n=1 Tax=Flavobacterium panacagri TaxID=3034146 RepID=UPI0025A6777A|nr:hypothetical protein [Flavobacterium panacagri]
MESFGDKLNTVRGNTVSLLFNQAEMAQLTLMSFEQNIQWLNELEDSNTVSVSFPIGFNDDHTPLMSNAREYKKEVLINKYSQLSYVSLPLNTIFQLVTLIESFLNDILRMILIEYPNKIPSSKKVDINCILLSKSIEEAKIQIVDTILNEIAYKSPRDYAVEFEKYTGVNLLENPVFHKYIEIKATRDIHIHNLGIANDIYMTKAGILARVKSGQYLPVDLQYFLMSYEQCLQLTEVLETEMDKIWPSAVYRKKIAEEVDDDAIQNKAKKPKTTPVKKTTIQNKIKK